MNCERKKRGGLNLGVDIPHFVPLARLVPIGNTSAPASRPVPLLDFWLGIGLLVADCDSDFAAYNS